MCVFADREVDVYDLQNQNLRPSFRPLRGSIWLFSGSKNPFSGLFESWFGVVHKSPRDYFWPETFHFVCIFSSKGRYLNSIIKILCQVLALCDGNFDHIQVQKTRYLGFLKSAEVGSCDSPTTWKTARFFINRSADRRSYLKTIPWSIFFIKHMCKVLVSEPNVGLFLIARRLYWDGWVNESGGSCPVGELINDLSPWE